MTVQELYDQLTDEQLADILTDLLTDKHHRGISKIHAIAAVNDTLIFSNPAQYIYKAAATRWLKNQSKCK